MTAKRSRTSQARSGNATGRIPPESVEAALALAAKHGRNALAEALLAGHALLDATSLALTGHAAVQDSDLDSKSDAVRAIARVVHGMDALAERLRSDEVRETRRLIDALLSALDAEIARWERQARDDGDARAVLRAFLGLRELLWELGLRPGPSAGDDVDGHGEPGGDAEPEPSATADLREERPKRKRAHRGEATGGPRKTESTPTRRRRVQRVDIES